MYDGFRLFADDRRDVETTADVPDLTSALALALYRLRRRRESLFSTALFSEPTWDLLLDLLAAEKTGKRVSITSACIAAAAPTTTALRCLKQLEQEGLIYREADATDRRRVYVRLSGDALASMDKLFVDLGRIVAVGSQPKSPSQRNAYQDGSCSLVS
jgi:DNA-binding MarR family transcriptional regulator